MNRKPQYNSTFLGKWWRRFGVWALLGWSALGVVTSLVAEETATVETKDSLPHLKDVTDTIQGHFGALKDYRSGDLIARGEVEKALDRVAELGWKIPGRTALEKRVLADNAFLVVQLRSKSGQRFMRRITSYPGGYDRLDRLSGISGGQRLVKDLIRGKGGHELIEYLTTSQGGANLGRMLTKAKDGKDFNKPTGRLYTVDALVKAVEEIYRDQLAKESADELP